RQIRELEPGGAEAGIDPSSLVEEACSLEPPALRSSRACAYETRPRRLPVVFVSKGALLLSPRGFATPVSTEKGSSPSVASSGESLAENEVRFALPRVLDQDRRDGRGRSIALVRGEKRARLVGPHAPPSRLREKRKSLESSLGLAAFEERSSEKNAGAIDSSLRV